MSTKHWVGECFDSINEGITLEDLLQKLLKIKELQDKGEAKNVYLQVYGEDSYPTLQMVGERPETDKEQYQRLKKEKAERERLKKRKQELEENERKQYERLKKKFEKLDRHPEMGFSDGEAREFERRQAENGHPNAKAHAKVMKKLKESTPEQVLQSAKDSGIYDENGQLTEPYRSEPEIFTENTTSLDYEQINHLKKEGEQLRKELENRVAPMKRVSNRDCGQTKSYRSELKIFTKTAKSLTHEQTQEIAKDAGILNQDGTLSDDYK